MESLKQPHTCDLDLDFHSLKTLSSSSPLSVAILAQASWFKPTQTVCFVIGSHHGRGPCHVCHVYFDIGSAHSWHEADADSHIRSWHEEYAESTIIRDRFGKPCQSSCKSWHGAVGGGSSGSSQSTVLTVPSSGLDRAPLIPQREEAEIFTSLQHLSKAMGILNQMAQVQGQARKGGQGGK